MPDFGAWTPAAWSALAEWVTAFVAVAAGAFAFQQVREARRLREEQSQPYVVAYMEPSAASEHLIDLVVRNFGSTVAVDVRLEIDPHPQRTVQGTKVEDVKLFDRLPVLVPGQEWRTSWDFGPDRAKAALPNEHRAVVTYSDSRGRKLPPLSSILDWGVYRDRRWIVLYGVHDAAKALRDMEKTFKKWQESIHGGLAVYMRDADARDEKQRQEFEDRRRQQDAGGSELEGA